MELIDLAKGFKSIYNLLLGYVCECNGSYLFHNETELPYVFLDRERDNKDSWIHEYPSSLQDEAAKLLSKMIKERNGVKDIKYLKKNYWYPVFCMTFDDNVRRAYRWDGNEMSEIPIHNYDANCILFITSRIKKGK